MKNTKRLLTWILVAVLAVLATTFVACVDKPTAQELTELILPTLDENQMAIIIKNGDKDYTNIVVTLGLGGVAAKNVEDVLAYLKDEGTIDLEWHDGPFGKSIDKLNKIQPASQSEWVHVFTSNASEQDVTAWATTYTVGEVKLTTSIVGVSELSVFNGCIIYFELGSM